MNLGGQKSKGLRRESGAPLGFTWWERRRAKRRAVVRNRGGPRPRFPLTKKLRCRSLGKRERAEVSRSVPPKIGGSTLQPFAYKSDQRWEKPLFPKDCIAAPKLGAHFTVRSSASQRHLDGQIDPHYFIQTQPVLMVLTPLSSPTLRVVFSLLLPLRTSPRLF